MGGHIPGAIDEWFLSQVRASTGSAFCTTEKLQAAVAAPRRRSLHINLVVHGQRICLPLVPKCSRCP